MPQSPMVINVHTIQGKEDLHCPISVKPAGRSMLVKDTPDRAYEPSILMLLGIVIDLYIVVDLNAYGPIVVMLSGIVTDVRLVQL